jgi:alpha,alpha-trehalase
MAVPFTDIDEAARNILRRNDKGGRYTIPTTKLYPFQWNWDSCFSALGWAVFDEARAWREIETLFLHQWPDGMVAHIAFHEFHDSYFPGPGAWHVPDNRPTSGITQPPVAATAVRMIYEQARDRDAATVHVCALLPKIFRYHHWFHSARDPDNTGLVAIFHPWESGRDNSPEWDGALRRVSTEGLEPYRRKDLDHVDSKNRPSQDDYDRYMAFVGLFRRHNYDQHAIYKTTQFRIADVGINAILLRANRDLLWLSEQISADIDQARIRQWIQAQEQGFETLWNKRMGAYSSRDMVMGENIDTLTSGAFLSFFAGAAKGAHAKAMLEHFGRQAQKARFLLPSLDPDDARFDRGRYWRGPVWAVVNFMAGLGLRESGYPEQAARLQKDIAQMIAMQGFREYFDPLSGEGLGGGDFSWTAAMWLAWAGR